VVYSAHRKLLDGIRDRFVTHICTSAWRSIPSDRNRRSASAPASPVKSMRKLPYCKMNASELLLMSFRVRVRSGSDGPINVSVRPSSVRQTVPARGYDIGVRWVLETCSASL